MFPMICMCTFLFREYVEKLKQMLKDVTVSIQSVIPVMEEEENESEVPDWIGG